MTALPTAGIVTGLWRYRKASGIRHTIVTAGTSLCKLTSDPTGEWALICGGDLEPNVPVGMAQFGDVLYFGTPNSGPFRYDGTTSYRAGVPAPTFIPYALTTWDPLPGPTYTYRWKITYVYGPGGLYGESAGSTESPANEWNFTEYAQTVQGPSGAGSVPADVTGIRLYRTKADGDVYYRVTNFHNTARTVTMSEVPVVAGTPSYTMYLDDVPDSELIEELDEDREDMPKGDLFAVYQSRLFIASTKHDIVYFSDLGFPDVHLAGNWIRAYTGHNDATVAIVPFGSALVMFKRSGIAVLSGTGPDTFTVRTIEGATGCVAGRSVVEANGALLYLARDGVYAFDGVSSRCVSNTIREKFRLVNEAAVHSACACAYKRAYWLSYPSSTSPTNDSYLRLDLDTGSWASGSDLTASCFLVPATAGDREYMWFGSPTSGYLYLADVRDFDGTGENIIGYFHTADLDFGLADVHKDFRRIWIEGESLADMTVTCETDSTAIASDLTFEASEGYLWDDATSLWDTATWADLAESTQAFRFPAGTVGRRLKLLFGTGDRATPWRIRSITIGYEPKRRWT